MSLRGDAVVVGIAEYAAQRFTDTGPSGLEMAADLTLRALDDAGLRLRDVNGIAINTISEAYMCLPATLSEYLGIRVRYADVPDLGGASAAAMVGHAAFAIERGEADVVACAVPGIFPSDPNFWLTGGSAYVTGSPRAEFEIPYGYLGANIQYALIAQRYAHVHGYDPRATAKIAVEQRFNALNNPNAIFFGQPISEEDVLASPFIAPPLRKLEIVRPVRGGSAVVLASREIAKRCRNRGARVLGYAESISHYAPHMAPDMLNPPLREAARAAFAMAGLLPSDIATAQMYDCYTINVIMGLEAAGFCEAGQGMAFVRGHDLTYRGNFPVNTNGGQLGCGQAGSAGGMTNVLEGVRQASGRAGDRQVSGDIAFIAGNGGIMSDQVALILRGD
jgi:acetyl-CoA C-acetyltransferase